MASSGSPEAIAVIGSGYGDEGKGLITDALSSSSTRVVRFNGGAQAGHTVFCEQHGRRHVFHHVGAGTFRGASTHLSKFFVVNPILALEELEALQPFVNGKLEITIDPGAAVTTPADMMINQAIEMARGANRHGSCGLGFNETIERTLYGPQLAAGALATDVSDILREIRTSWVPKRCEALHLDPETLPLEEAHDARFRDECRLFGRCIEMRHDTLIAAGVDRVIFEGAQGLGLDQNIGTFPYVTRSHTGLPNVLTLCRDAGIEHISAAYVTRAYATRHGAGPLSQEDEWSGPTPADATNVTNEWQGHLRYAPLDLKERMKWISEDIFRCRGRNAVSIKTGLVVTCLDQVGIPLFNRDPMRHAQIVSREINLPLWGTSWGPRECDFQAQM